MLIIFMNVKLQNVISVENSFPFTAGMFEVYSD